MGREAGREVDSRHRPSGKRDLFDGGPPEVVPHSGLPFVKRFLAVEQCEAQPMIVTCAEHLNKSMQRLAKREDIPGGRIDEAPVYLKRTEPPCSDFASDRIPRKDLRMSTSLRKRMKQNKSKSHLNSAYGSKCVLSCVPGDQEKYLRQRSSLPIYGHSSGRHTPLRSSGNFLIRHFSC